MIERIYSRDKEINSIRPNHQKGELEKTDVPRGKRTRSIEDVLVDVEILIDTHFFNEFYETKSSLFLKKSDQEPEFD